MIIQLPHLITIFSIAFHSCAETTHSNNPKIEGYTMNEPVKKLVLPGILNEVSGLTDIDSNTIACVQDENGIIFIYDIVRNEIIKQLNFHIDGDYEGITLVGKTMYILRSDGTLFEISDYEAPDFKLHSYVTGIPANNNEGLCYDSGNDRLLIACKSKIGKGSEFKDKRVVYSFDLKTGKLSKDPVFSFDVGAIKAFAVEQELDVPIKEKKKFTEPDIKFFPSAIAIHPITKKLFVLSAVDHMLFIFSNSGRLEHIEVLNPNVFNKAEGITFFNDGDMIITNEAQNASPTLIRFDYKQ